MHINKNTLFIFAPLFKPLCLTIVVAATAIVATKLSFPNKKINIFNENKSYFLVSKFFDDDYVSNLEDESSSTPPLNGAHLIKSIDDRNKEAQKISERISQSKDIFYENSQRNYKCAVPEKQTDKFFYDFDCEIFQIHSSVTKSSQIFKNIYPVTDHKKIEFQKFYVLVLNNSNIKTFKTNAVIEIVSKTSSSISARNRFLQLQLNYKFDENHDELSGKTRISLFKFISNETKTPDTVSQPQDLWGCYPSVDDTQSNYGSMNKCLIVDVGLDNNNPLDFLQAKIITDPKLLDINRLYVILFLRSGYHIKNSVTIKQDVYSVLYNNDPSSLNTISANKFSYSKTLIGLIDLEKPTKNNIFLLD